MKGYAEYIGRKYGRWTVLVALVGTPVKFKCRCDCGREYAVYRRSLVTGNSNQCLYCRNKANGTTHGMSDTKLHRAWSDMKRRCTAKSDKRYMDYGGRGILICPEWMKFEPFMEWSLANGYAEHLSIDRIDNDGNYEPSNCRWATVREQSLNKRSTRYANLYGHMVTLTEISEMYGINKSSLDYRYDVGIRDEHILAKIGRKQTRVINRKLEGVEF